MKLIHRNIFILFLLMFGMSMTFFASGQTTDSKLKIGFFYSNNICFSKYESDDVLPGYGYNFGLKLGYKIGNRTYLHSGINNLKHSYSREFAREESFTGYTDEQIAEYISKYGNSPYTYTQKVSNVFIGIPITFKTYFYKGFYLNYGTGINFRYKLQMNDDMLSSDGVKNNQSREYILWNEIELSRISLGLTLGPGYSLRITDYLLTNFELEFNMPYLIHGKNYPINYSIYTVGLKIGVDLTL